MTLEEKILNILIDFETFKLTDDEQGCYAKTTSYFPYIERIKALTIPAVIKSGCYKECGNTQPSGGGDNICLNCGSSIKQTVL